MVKVTIDPVPVPTLPYYVAMVQVGFYGNSNNHRNFYLLLPIICPTQVAPDIPVATAVGSGMDTKLKQGGGHFHFVGSNPFSQFEKKLDRSAVPSRPGCRHFKSRQTLRGEKNLVLATHRYY